MSFRYKSALLSLITVAALYGFYFVRVLEGLDGGAQIGLLVRTIIAIVIVLIVGHIILAITSPDRYAPMDERERTLDRRATQIGYYLLIMGALAAAAMVHFGHGAADMANAILLAVVVADSVQHAAFLALHHRAG